MEFKWKSNKDAAKYQVEVSNSSDFEKPLVSVFVTQPLMTRDLPPGSYFMRVRAYDQADGKGKWSIPRRITVTPEVFTQKKEQTTVTYLGKAPDLHAEWVSEKKDVQVIVAKNGNTIQNINISGNRYSYKPEGSGRYTVSIRTNTNGHYGRPTLVSDVLVEEIKLESPNWRLLQDEWNTNKSIDLEWSAVSNATAYKITISPLDNQAKVKAGGESSTYNISDTTLTLPHLAEGEYQITIVATAKEASSEPASTKIKVSSSDSLKFRQVQLEMGFGIGTYQYNHNSLENNSVSTTEINNARSSKLYGRALFNLNQSIWKLDLRSSMTAFSFSGGSAIATDFQAVPGVAVESFLCSSCRIFFGAGARYWTMPVLSRKILAAETFIESSTQTLAGAVLNSELQWDFSRRSKLKIYGSASTPLLNSTGGRNIDKNSSLESTPNYSIGSSIQTSGSSGVSVMLSIEHEYQEFSVLPKDSNTVQIRNTNILLGLNTTVGGMDETKNIFSSFDFSIGPTFEQGVMQSKTQHYSGKSYDNSDFYGQGLGWQARTQGWFKNSNNGIKFIVDTKNLGVDGYHGHLIGDYTLAWRRRFSNDEPPPTFENYFGPSSRTLSHIFEDTQGQKSISLLSTLGLTEGIILTQPITKRLSFAWLNEVYFPLAFIMTTDGIRELTPTSSFKTQFTFSNRFGSSFSVDLNLAYKHDEARYVSKFATYTSQHVIQRASVISLLGVFSL